MAKKSMIQRELKRFNLVFKFSKKRSIIKENLKYAKDLNLVFSFQKSLQKLPTNS
jgi:hypothetical protein